MNLIASNSKLKMPSENKFKDDSFYLCNTNSPKKRISSALSTKMFKLVKFVGGRRINQYVIEKKLGKGSFATVHLA
jgi:hypothetical protein